MLLSDRTDFKTTTKNVARVKEGHFIIIIKESIIHEGITIINIYTPSNRIPKYMKQKLTEMKGKRHSSTIVVGDFITSFNNGLDN